MSHLTDYEFVALLHRGDGSPALFTTSLIHLSACPQCRREFLDRHGRRARQLLIDFFGPQAVDEWQDGEIEVPAVPVKQATRAYHLLQELEESSSAHAGLLAGNRRAGRSLLGAIILLEEAKRLWNGNPNRAEILIRASEGNLRSLLAEHPLIAAAHLSRCLAYRANIFRLRADLVEAEKTITEAWAWSEIAVADWPRLRKEILLYHGLIQREQRKLSAAIAKLEAALEPPGPTGGYTIVIEGTITLSHAYWEAGHGKKAVAILEKVLYQYSHAELGDILYLAALQSLTVRRAETGQPAKARAMLPALRDALSRVEQADLLKFRLTWAEADICKAEGNRAAAASLFRETIQICMNFNLLYDAALAALELALLHLEAGDTSAAKELAEELVPIFEAREIHREATVAGLVLVEALRKEVATVGQVREVTDIVFYGKRANLQHPLLDTLDTPPEGVAEV